MKINKIHIDGYRSLKDFKIDNLADVNIFYGENNTGKSNIIQALDVFFSKKIRIVEGVEEVTPRFEGKINLKRSDYFRNQEKRIYFGIELSFEEEDIKILSEKIMGTIGKNLLKIIKKKGNTIFIEAEISPELEDKRRGEFNVKSLKIDGIETLFKGNGIDYRPLGEKIKDFLIQRFGTIGANRQIVKETDRGDKEESIGDNNIQKYLFELCHSEDEPKHVLFRKINNGFNDLYNEIGDIEFSFEHDGHYIEEKQGIIKEKNVNEIKINVFSSKENQLLPIDNYGTGVKQSLILISNIIANNESKIFGIEELELNLSPNSQESVFEKLLEIKDSDIFGVNQLFLTSHSPVFEIMDKKNTIVYKVEMKDGSSSINEMTRKEFIEHMQPAFTSYKYCNECDDMINSSIVKMSKNLGVDVRTAKEFYDKHNLEICGECEAKGICDTTKKEIIEFVENKLKELKEK